LSRRRRRDRNVRRLVRTKSISKRIEDLPLGELSDSCFIVGRNVFRTRRETRLCIRINSAWSDLEFLKRSSITVEPSLRCRIVISTMALAARVLHNQLAAEEDLAS